MPPVLLIKLTTNNFDKQETNFFFGRYMSLYYVPDHMVFKYISNQSIMDLIERRVKAFAQDFLMLDPSLII